VSFPNFYLGINQLDIFFNFVSIEGLHNQK
jgi:hypothetical protein